MDLPLAWPESSRPRSQLRYVVSGPQHSNLQQLSETAFRSCPTGAGLELGKRAHLCERPTITPILRLVIATQRLRDQAWSPHFALPRLSR